ncbi:MAG: hypothetical protein HYY17_05395 [Planctomycetes bacterium]|nr:hypothetical protein [Planctomycetota bacterium]
MRSTAAFLLSLAIAGPALAQDVVRLRNGRHIGGTVVIDETDQNGFKVIRWDTGGTVYVLRSQVTEYEWTRLRSAPADAQGDALEGVRVVTTANREVIGVLVDAAGTAVTPLPKSKEALDTIVRVKTRDAATPVSVPRASIALYEPLKIREADAYSATEMVDRRLKAVDPKEAAKLIEVAQFARGLKLYDRAKEILQQAAAADPARKEEIDAQIAQLDLLIKEQQAEAKLAEILKLAEAGKFDDALAAADKFVQEFADTKAAKNNPDLVARLKKDQENYAKNRAEFLAQRVPEAWRSVRSSLFTEYARSKYKVDEARQLVARMDDEILDKLSKKFNGPPEDAAKAWERRDQKRKTVDMGTGSWIYKGGQDGGYDYESAGSNDTGDDLLDDFTRRLGRKKKDDKQQQETGLKIDTKDKWWAEAGDSKRRAWLETEYGLTSKYVKKEKEEEKKCSRCQGAGTLKATRGGKSVDVICPVCHKTGVVVSVTYW